MEKIYDKKKLLGICARKFFMGTNAITAASEPLQVIALKHKKGTTAKAHLHAGYQKTIFKTQTCFIVKKGKIRIDIYNLSKKYVNFLLLNIGDLFISLAGGHAISYLTDAEVIEIKNGPFGEDKIIIGE